MPAIVVSSRPFSIAISCEVRGGSFNGRINCVEVAQIAEAVGVELVAVHGRTRMQLYHGASDWDVIGEVKRAVQIPVLGSGDVVSVATARERLRRSRADGLLIDSVCADLSEVEEFCSWFHELPVQVPLFAVPTTFSEVTDGELEEIGIAGVAYANHLLRSAYPAMLQTAQSILTSGRAAEVEAEILPVEDLLDLFKS